MRYDKEKNRREKIYAKKKRKNQQRRYVRSGKVQAIINTVGNKRTFDEDGAAIRSSAIEHGVPLFTALDTADAMVRVLESRGFITQAI